MAKLQDDIYATKIRCGKEDKLVWNPSKNHVFHVKSNYKALRGGNYFPWQSIWQVCVPPRVAFFTWCVALGKTLAMDNLRKWGIVVMDYCFICKSHGESVTHLLLHCVVTWELCSLVFCLFGVHWAVPYSVIELLSCWKGHFG